MTHEPTPLAPWSSAMPEVHAYLSPEQARLVSRPSRWRTALRWILPIAVVVALSAWALAADYQCRPNLPEPGKCTAQISEGGQLKTVEFRKGDIICTEDGWIVYTGDPSQPCSAWYKLKAKKGGGTSTSYTVGAGALPASQAQARAPFVLYHGLGLARRWDGSTVLFDTLTTVASGYYEPIGGTWRAVGPVAVKR